MLQLIQLDEIHSLLLLLPDLYNQLERRDVKLLDNTKNWLLSCERVCKKNGLIITSNIAGLRGLIISVERGVRPKEIEILGKYSNRKILDGTIVYCLREAGELVTRTIKKDHDRIDEAERIIMQIVTIGISKGLIIKKRNSEDNAEYLKNIWTKLSLDSEIIGGVSNVLSLVRQNDILVILDKTLSYY